MTANPAQFATSIAAGLIAGIRTILGSAAMVTLIMPGSLPGGIQPALVMLLTGGAVLAAVVAALSTFPGTVAQVQDGPAVILGVMASTLAATLQASAPPEMVIVLILACANVVAFAAGAIYYGLGAYRLGALMRFIPYPVIGGFLAGSGLLILMGAGRVLAGGALADVTLSVVTEPLRIALWLPGVAFGVVFMLVLRHWHNALVVPGILFGGIALYHAGMLAAGISIPDAQAAGLLLGPFPESAGLQLPAWARLPAADWWHMVPQIPTFGAILLVSIVGLLLNVGGLELATRSEIDINRELRAAGVANMASGLLGGGLGFHALSASVLGFGMGANSRLIGLAAGAMCAGALLAGLSLLAFMPKAILGGLLLTMGAGLLLQWLYDGWSHLPIQDYVVVALIVAVIGTAGILTGVLVGIGVAILLFVLSYSRVRVIRHELTGAEFSSNVDRGPVALQRLKAKGHAIRVVKLEGLIFFGTAYSVLTQMQQRLKDTADTPLRYLLLDFHHVPATDSSAMSAFAKIHGLCERNDCELVFTRMSEDIERQFKRAGIDPDILNVRFFGDLDHALEYCEDNLLASEDGADLAAGGSIWERIAAALPEGTPLSAFQAYLTPRIFQPGEYLVKQGDQPTEIIFIESGRVTVQVTFPDGRSIRLRAMTMGTMHGELGLYQNQPHSDSAIADELTHAYVLTTEKLHEMEHNDPKLANSLHYTIVALLSDRLIGTSLLLQRLIH